MFNIIINCLTFNISSKFTHEKLKLFSHQVNNLLKIQTTTRIIIYISTFNIRD